MQLDIFELIYEDYKLPKDRPVRLVEMFAGIGTQKMAFDAAGIDCEVIAIVEIDKYALLSYAAAHTDYLEARSTYFKENEISHKEMLNSLQNKNVGFNFITGRFTIDENTNIETLRNYYLADKLSKNLGDVSKLKGAKLPKGIDVLTYGFPCTDLSKAGDMAGLKNTRSGLVYEVFRVIEELDQIRNKPDVLIMENVIDLIQRRFKRSFGNMQSQLQELGYQNYAFEMNAKDYGIPQNRRRIFMVSLLGEYNFKQPKPTNQTAKLIDFLEEQVSEDYYITEEFLKRSNIEKKNGWVKIPEDTKQGWTRAEAGDGIYLDRPHQKRGVVQKQSIPTIKLGNKDLGIITEDLRIRKLTETESWRLMGISDPTIKKAQQTTSQAQLYRQSGNAIVVNALSEILKGLK